MVHVELGVCSMVNRGCQAACELSICEDIPAFGPLEKVENRNCNEQRFNFHIRDHEPHCGLQLKLTRLRQSLEDHATSSE